MEPDDVKPPQAPVAVEPREPWDKKSDESLKAFSAFVQYRDSEKRSLTAIAESLKCSTQNIHQWSIRHNWKLRCDAFDLFLDRQQREDFARRRTRMRDRHLSVAGAMLGVAAFALKEWQNKIEQKQPLGLAPEQIALLTKCATEIEHRILDADGAHSLTTINVTIGELSDEAFEDECKNPTKRLGGSGQTMPLAEFERLQWEQLSDAEKEAEAVWRDPPKPKLN